MVRFEAIHWGNGEWWWLLLIPVALVPLWVGYEYFVTRVTRAFSGQGLVARMTTGPGFGRRLAAAICVFLALEFLFVATLRPRYGLKEVAVAGLGVDIALVLDASRSMMANDLTPNRLTSATVEINRFLDASRGNRVALIPFAGIPFIQSPLTVDHAVIKQYLEELRVSDIPVPGTALGRALKVAAKSLGLTGDKPTGSAHKAIILFTDGENHEGDPGEVAKTLAELGVRVFTVGVGTPNGQPIPTVDDKGNVVKIARQEDGVSLILSKLNEELLRDISAKTGGKYLALTPGSDVAGELARETDALEKAEYQAQVNRLLEDRFQYPLAIGIVFLLLPLLWAGGRGRWVQKAVATALLVVGVAGTARADGFFDRDHPKVTDALELLDGGKAGEAVQTLEALTSVLPPRADLFYDIAIANTVAGNHDKAIEYIDKALDALTRQTEQTPEVPPKARALHAKGTILGEKARKMSGAKADPREVRQVYRQAVLALSQALILDPTAKDTQNNLEIAALAAFPPCSKLDDDQEPNNNREQAQFIKLDPETLTATNNLLLCPDDEDWFKIQLGAGETLFAEVQKTPKTEEPVGVAQGISGTPDTPAEQPEPADVDMTLSKEDATTLVTLVKQTMYRTTEPENVVVQITGPKQEDGVVYVLETRVIPACPDGDDGMESNDSRDAARTIENGDHSLRVCSGDEDWFSYMAKKGESKQISMQTQNGEGPLGLDVYTADGAPLDVQTSVNESGTASGVTLPQAEQDAPYLIRVFGPSTEGFYNLSIKDPEGQNQDQKQQDQQEQEQEEPKQEEQGSQTMRELLEAIDGNDENLEAQEAARNSPLKDYIPEKDW